MLVHQYYIVLLPRQRLAPSTIKGHFHDPYRPYCRCIHRALQWQKGDRVFLWWECPVAQCLDIVQFWYIAHTLLAQLTINECQSIVNKQWFNVLKKFTDYIFCVAGWLFKLRLSNPSELESLMTPETYAKFLEGDGWSSVAHSLLVAVHVIRPNWLSHFHSSSKSSNFRNVSIALNLNRFRLHQLYITLNGASSSSVASNPPSFTSRSHIHYKFATEDWTHGP